MKRRDFLRLAACCGASTALDWQLSPGILSAKDLWPSSRRIVWISQTQPGSGQDMIPRGMSPYLTSYIREQVPSAKGGDVIIRNEPAAAGRKAYEMVLRAKPDGYTIGGIDLAFITDLVTEKIEFDVTQYTYLARLSSARKVIVTGKNGFKSWKEAMDAAKSAPLRIAVGQFGRGNHVAGILLKEALGFNGKFIATNSTAENMAMVMRGDTQVGVGSEDSVSNLIKAKEIRVILTYDESKDYPGSVSLPALGHPQVGGYAAGQRCAMAPPGLPKDITRILVTAFKRTMENKEFQDWGKKVGLTFDPLYGEEVDNLVKRYIKYLT
jgi:tripartite-type tricarboxylate transporter receptor subunit TctC